MAPSGVREPFEQPSVPTRAGWDLARALSEQSGALHFAFAKAPSEALHAQSWLNVSLSDVLSFKARYHSPKDVCLCVPAQQRWGGAPSLPHLKVGAPVFNQPYVLTSAVNLVVSLWRLVPSRESHRLHLHQTTHAMSPAATLPFVSHHLVPHVLRLHSRARTARTFIYSCFHIIASVSHIVLQLLLSCECFRFFCICRLMRVLTHLDCDFTCDPTNVHIENTSLLQ